MTCLPTNPHNAGGQPRRATRAIHLLSGGLDSQLAACVLREQGVEVLCVVFQSLFFDPAKGRQAAERLGFPLLVEDFNADILALLRHAPHGFGSAINPCIDCHIGMIRRAGDIMRERGLDFVSTGEVLNQRPMSQNPQALRMVARDSGLEDLLLRPLSAQLLPATRPEREQLIDRTRLMDIEGRSRKRQMALAQHFLIHDYPQPAGGCLLTDPNYSLRLRDLRDHEGLEDRIHIRRLRLGRHFRLPGSRLVVGRHHSDNLLLEEDWQEAEALLRPIGFPGATGLLRPAVPADLTAAAAICSHYGKPPAGRLAAMTAQIKGQPEQTLETTPAGPALIEGHRIFN